MSTLSTGSRPESSRVASFQYDGVTIQQECGQLPSRNVNRRGESKALRVYANPAVRLSAHWRSLVHGLEARSPAFAPRQYDVQAPGCEHQQIPGDRKNQRKQN